VLFRFEKTFKECISSTAIKIKFEQHHKRGSEVVKDLEQLVSEEETNAMQIG
jgi:mitofusin